MVSAVHETVRTPARLRTPSPARLAVLATFLGLGVFHAWLFWERVATASLLEPVVALRWLGAFLVLATSAALHRRGLLLGNGRALIVLALVAALLHVAPAAEQDARTFLPSQILLAAASSVVALAALDFRTGSGPLLAVAAVDTLSDRLFDAGLTHRPLDRGPPPPG